MKNLDRLEAQRVELERGRKRFRTIALVFFVAAAAIGAISGSGHGVVDSGWGPMDGRLFGALVAMSLAGSVIIVAVFLSGGKRRALEEAFKGEVVAAELQSALEDVDYQPRGSYTKDYVGRLGVFRHFDRAKGSDYLQAKYRGRKFSRCDQKLFIEEKDVEQDSDGTWKTRTWLVEVFGGTITALELPSPCPARLLVTAGGISHTAPIPKQGEAPKQRAIFGSGTGKALDSLKFKREYHVIGNNDETLTPNRTKCLRKLDENITNPFAVLFEGNHLHLIVQGENFFEIETGKNAASMADQQNRVAEEVKKLTQRLDLLLEM